MGKRSKSYSEHLLEQLRDPAESAAYLKAVVQDPDTNQALLMRALRNVVESLGLSYVSQITGLNRQNLYRMLSGEGNPRLSSLLSLLKVLGLRLDFEAELEALTENENAINVTIESNNKYVTVKANATFEYTSSEVSQWEDRATVTRKIKESYKNEALASAA